jgi:hypothetical protein
MSLARSGLSSARSGLQRDSAELTQTRYSFASLFATLPDNPCPKIPKWKSLPYRPSPRCRLPGVPRHASEPTGRRLSNRPPGFNTTAIAFISGSISAISIKAILQRAPSNALAPRPIKAS